MPSKDRAGTILAALAASTLSACIVLPIPVKAHASGPGGVLTQPPELSFVRAGATTRDDVQRTLSDIEVTTGLTDHFWGRWSYQRWVVVAAVASMSGGAAGSSDVIEMNNVLIDFDATGLATTVRRVPDRRLLNELAVWARATKPDPQPAELLAFHLYDSRRKADDSVVTLRADGITIACVGKRKHQMTASLKGIRLQHLTRKSDSPENVEAALIVVIVSFPDKTPLGRNITLEIGASDLFRLIEFAEHYGR